MAHWGWIIGVVVILAYLWIKYQVNRQREIQRIAQEVKERSKGMWNLGEDDK